MLTPEGAVLFALQTAARVEVAANLGPKAEDPTYTPEPWEVPGTFFRRIQEQKAAEQAAVEAVKQLTLTKKEAERVRQLAKLTEQYLKDGIELLPLTAELESVLFDVAETSEMRYKPGAYQLELAVGTLENLLSRNEESRSVLAQLMPVFQKGGWQGNQYNSMKFWARAWEIEGKGVLYAVPFQTREQTGGQAAFSTLTLQYFFEYAEGGVRYLPAKEAATELQKILVPKDLTASTHLDELRTSKVKKRRPTKKIKVQKDRFTEADKHFDGNPNFIFGGDD